MKENIYDELYKHNGHSLSCHAWQRGKLAFFCKDCNEIVFTISKPMEAYSSEEQQQIRAECYSCVFQGDCEGSAHISCKNPDPYMKGSEYGIKNGWFFYPLCFDPVWKEIFCSNYKLKGGSASTRPGPSSRDA